MWPVLGSMPIARDRGCVTRDTRRGDEVDLDGQIEWVPSRRVDGVHGSYADVGIHRVEIARRHPNHIFRQRGAGTGTIEFVR